MDPVQWILDHGEKVGLVTGLGLIIVALVVGWLVTGREYKKAVTDCNEHKEERKKSIERLEQSLALVADLTANNRQVLQVLEQLKDFMQEAREKEQ